MKTVMIDRKEQGGDGTLNSIKRKLTSQTGASITYALLLFLVCAVVSSIILAAATAASGRISGSVSSDQRYYSVTSAVQLLKKQIDDGKSNTIVCPGIEKNGEIDFDPEKTYLATFDKDALDSTLGIKEFGSVVVGGLGGLKDVSLDENNQFSQTLTCAVSVGGVTTDALEVEIIQTIIAGEFPMMTLDVYNKDATNGKYTLRLTFTADVEESVGKKKKKDTSGVETIDYTVTKKITWNYYSIETAGVTTAATTTTSGGGS